MLNAGIIAAIVGTIFGGILSVMQKKMSVQYTDNNLALVYQYISMAFWALVFAGVYSYIQGMPLLPDLSVNMRLLVVGLGIVGFAGIAFLFKAFENMNAGIALVIANLSVFIMYLLNVSLFPDSEVLSLPKIIIAIIFFVIVAQFLIQQGGPTVRSRGFINTKSLYAVGTAICRAVFFVGNNYFVKTGTMGPIHSMFVTESIILIVALIRYLMQKRNALRNIIHTVTKKDALMFGAMGLSNVAYASLTYYGYLSNPGNIINFIKLFTVVTTSVLARIFLKDYLTKKQIRLLIASMAALIAFLFV